MIKTITASFLFLLSSLTWSYGDLGHKSVAAVAWQHMTPYAKQNIGRILGMGQDKFIKASVWADHIKRDERFNYLKPMHYVNMPKDEKRYVKSRDCKKDRCVVEAIHTFSKVARTGSDSEKRLAVRMLIHLIADIHQPLHAGLKEDRGGNWYEIQYEDKTVSLHKLWDHQLVKRLGENWESVSLKVLEDKKPVTVGSPAIWAEESHWIAVESLYKAKENKEVTEAYLAMADTITQRQLAKAGWRLAMWLNKL